MTIGEVQLLDMGDHSIIVIGDEYLDDEGNLHPLSELSPVAKEMSYTEALVAFAKGDVAGHAFHGNQWETIPWSGGGFDKDTADKALANAVRNWKSNPDPVKQWLSPVLSGEKMLENADGIQKAYREQCASLLNAVATKSVTANEEMYRGVRLFKTSTEQVMSKYPKGKVIDIPLAGFTPNPMVASKFARGSYGPLGYREDKNPSTAQVTFVVENGSQVYPLNEGKTDFANSETEALMGGKFEVTNVEDTRLKRFDPSDRTYSPLPDSQPKITITLRQVDTLHPPRGGFQ